MQADQAAAPHRPTLRAPRAAAVLGLLAVASGCGPPNDTPDVHSAAVDIFVRAADRVAGGALLGVWVAPQPEALSGRYSHRAYIVGGYVGVDRALLGGAPVGRLLGYDNAGEFTTLCTLGWVPRAVHGEDGRVFAAGDGARVLVYSSADGRCREFEAPWTGAGERPTFYALRGTGRAPHEIYIAGGSDAAAGPKGVVFRFDGERLEQVAMPAGATSSNLYGVTYEPSVGFWIVGDRGAALNHAPGASGWVFDRAMLPTGEDHLTAVTTLERTADRWTMAVGGTERRTILARRATAGWEVRHAPASIPPLRGIFSENNFEVFMVGLRGATVAFTGRDYYEARPLTTTDLLALHGNQGLIIAVGGNVDDATPAQHGVILVRGDARTTYAVDRVIFRAAGRERAFEGCLNCQ